MKGLPIDRVRTFGDPVLKQGASRVTRFDADLRRLSGLMFEVMEREQGVGLAAPQVGVNKALMVWEDPETGERNALANPRIVERSDELVGDAEGCLSLPGHSMHVDRAARVVVEGEDLEGRTRRFEAEGLLARIMQHEVDHLEGRLILDRTTREDRKRVLRALRDSELGV
ncbi:MAG: peptide deformylase [Thermoleophilia bacterium]